MKQNNRVGRVNNNLVKVLLETYNNKSKNKPYNRILTNYNNLPANEKNKINETVINSFASTGNLDIKMVLSIIKCHLEYLKANNNVLYQEDNFIRHN